MTGVQTCALPILMKTKFPFEISIDENKFKLEYRELKKSEARDLIGEFAELKKQIDASDALKSEIASLEEKKEIKKDIAFTQSGKEKAKTMQEVLTLIEQIEAKRAEQKELASASIDLDVAAKKSEGKVIFYELDDDHVKHIFREGLDHIKE